MRATMRHGLNKTPRLTVMFERLQRYLRVEAT